MNARTLSRLNFILCLSLFWIASCSNVKPTATTDADRSGEPAAAERRPVEITPVDALPVPLPPLKREFRGAWVATVDNIDWPSQAGLTTEAQQDEMLAILDRAVELHLNAIVFQVRPTADAFYASDLEPWSAYLTGRQGVAPDPFYDPLAFTVEQAHDRGLEVHAWVNPFRAYHPTAEEAFDPSHAALKNFTVVYGNQRWMDPGNPEATEHSIRVIRDIVQRYDVDGIHMDDYFYPYPIQGQGGDEEPFPDDASWNAYQLGGGEFTKPDWRRENVDRFIERVYHEVKEIKPWVKVGVSPFGIWRPGYPEGIVGFDAYNGLYADARKWLQNGWIDYMSPQLYWAMDSEGQSYPRLLAWWIEQNDFGRHIWPGNFTSRIILEGSRYWDAPELIRQIRHTQETVGAEGNIHFSMKALMPSGHAMGDRLLEAAYQDQALVSASTWLGGTPPGAPMIKVLDSGSGLEVDFSMPDGEAVWLWAVQTLLDGTWVMDVVPGSQSHFRLPRGYGNRPAAAIAVSAIERTGIAGPVTVGSFADAEGSHFGW